MKKGQIFSFRSDDLEGLRERVKRRELLDSDYQLIQGVVAFVIPVLRAAEEMRISLRRLQNLLFGKRTEKKRRPDSGMPDKENSNPSTGSSGQSDPETATPADGAEKAEPDTHHSPGHGRMRASAYLDAETIPISGPNNSAPAAGREPFTCCEIPPSRSVSSAVRFSPLKSMNSRDFAAAAVALS